MMSQKIAKKQRSSIESNIITIYVTRTLGLWAVINGLLINVGGAQHWSSSIYNFLNLMPGSPYTWGISSMIVGLLVIIGSITGIHFGRVSLRNIGLWATALWCLAIVMGLGVAALTIPGLSYNVATTYLFFAVLSIFMTYTRFTP